MLPSLTKQSYNQKILFFLCQETFLGLSETAPSGPYLECEASQNAQSVCLSGVQWEGHLTQARPQAQRAHSQGTELPVPEATTPSLHPLWAKPVCKLPLEQRNIYKSMLKPRYTLSSYIMTQTRHLLMWIKIKENSRRRYNKIKLLPESSTCKVLYLCP